MGHSCNVDWTLTRQFSHARFAADGQASIHDECKGAPSLTITRAADHVLNTGFTLTYGAPQLIEYMGVGPPKPMQDEPNDMHAVGVVLFQLLASIDPVWQRQYGEWMFGPMNKDIMEYIKLKKEGEQKSFTRAVLQKEHKEWVRHYTALAQT